MPCKLRLAALCSMTAIAASAQDYATVKNRGLAVHREMSIDSAVLTILGVGEKVRIDWSVAAAGGVWCSVSRIEPPAPLGFVPCEGLVKQPAPAPPVRQAQTLTRAQMAWGLAASALLTEHNGERHDTLTGVAITRQSAGAERERMAHWWDASDRDGLLRALNWIDSEGHRKGFSGMGEAVADLSDGEFQAFLRSGSFDGEQKQELTIAHRYYRQLGDRSLTGWDYARYISLCRWGHTAGYLDETEAWQGIMHAAGILRHTFRSWRELGENYLIGRQFWSREETRTSGQSFQAAFEKLLRDPASPWNRIPWDLEMPGPR